MTSILDLDNFYREKIELFAAIIDDTISTLPKGSSEVLALEVVKLRTLNNYLLEKHNAMEAVIQNMKNIPSLEDEVKQVLTPKGNI